MRLSLFIGGSTSGRSGDGPPVGSIQRSRRSLIRLVDILIALLVLSSLPAAAAGPEAFRPETVLAAGLAHGLSDALSSRYSGEAMGSSRDASDGPGRRRPATSGRPNLTLTVRDARATRMAPFAANYNSWNFNYGDADRVTTPHRFVATKPGTAVAKAGRSCFKSFGGETRVLMGDGTTKPISEILVGDFVLAQDPETGEVSARRISDTWVHDDDLVRLEIDGDIVRTTEDHPFWNATDSEWQRADELSLGDSVLTADGRRVKVGVLLGSSGRGSAYNLTVEGLHTYHVLFGADAVLVHNADCFDFVGEAADYADDELASMARRHIAGASNKRPSEAAILEAMQTGTATRIRGSVTTPGAVQFVKGKVTVIINEVEPWKSTAFFPGAG